VSPVEHLPRYLLSFFAAVAVSALLTPVMGGLAERFGILDRPRPGRFHRRATPYLGGLAVGAGLVTVGAAASGLSGEVATILVCGAAMCLLGFVDDWRTVRPLPKILVEVSAGAALWAVGIRAGLFGVASLDFGLTVLWVFVVVNAVNLGDNMDGLASGLAALSALGFFGIAAGEGHFLVASLAVAVCGASLGFLGHNFPPAKIFLGDAGSLLLGFLLAALGLELDIATQPGIVRAALPVLVLAVPLFDMAVVVAVRFLERRPIYVGATDHTSHRLAARGVSPSGVAFAAFGIQAACSALAVVLFNSSRQVLVVGVTAFAALAAVGWGVLVHDGRRPAAPFTAVVEPAVVEPTAPDQVLAQQNAGE
jgi:UDP-GlcNAc:undecaprenyl-phosphate/decaprenyl-phosphate GlcNAc-1-phosphate transferase